MNVQRSLLAAAALCLSGACVAGCSAGIVTPRANGSPSSRASSPPGRASAPPSLPSPPGSPSVSVSHTVVSVGGSIGDFPIPPGAEVFEKVVTGTSISIVLSSVAATEVSRFYDSALPRDGYKITQNTVGTGFSITGASIDFTGRGYRGQIGAESGLTGNLVGITLKPQ
jgi:hypothetical protein